MYYNNIIQEDLSNIVSNIKNLERLKNKTILITGATGMIASYFMYTLMYLNDKYNFNIKILPLVRNSNKLEEMTECSKRNDIYPIVQDVCDNINISEKIDYIAHMASSANPTNIVNNPVGIISANVLGTLNVLSLAKDKKSEILFTSTREIYGKMPENVYDIKETDMGSLNPTELRSCYPESKRMAENLIVSYCHQHGVDYDIARIAHSYGPGMIINNDGRIMSDLIGNVVNGENIVLKSKGDALRAFCYITDCVTGLFTIMLSNNKNEVYNLSNETEEISIRDLAYLLSNISNLKSKVVFDIQENNNQYVNFKRVKLNNEKLYELGWHPNVKLNDGLKKTIDYFENIKENNKTYEYVRRTK